MSAKIASCLLLLLAVVWSAAAADRFSVVRAGQPQVEVEVGEQDAAARKWAAELIKYIRKSTAAELPLSTLASGRKIKLEIRPEAHSDPEGFSFTFPDENTLLISGASENGIKFAVYEFLERSIHLRLLFPGELGEYWESSPDLSVPRTAVKMQPKYLSRYIGAGANTPETREFYNWSRALKANNPRIWIRHFLAEMLPVEKHGAAHPEFYPVFNGKRVLPKPGQKTFWQPCFTAPGLAEALAGNAVAYLRANLEERGMEMSSLDPRRTTVSLGVNDAGGYCQCAECAKLNGDRINMVGSKDYSPTYVPLINRTADLITAQFPDCRIPFLAYGNVMDIPENSGKLNKRLVPTIAYDSMYLADPERKATYRRVVEAWHRSLPELAVWDYIWGGAYVLPRVYPALFTENLRWHYQHGVVHYYSELFPGKEWTEGPKVYLILKLLWDPDCDPDAVLQDWYNCAVGEKAAPLLKQYFDNLEQFWLNGAPKSDWFKALRVYSEYGKSDYLAEYRPEALAESERLLKEVVRLAGSPAQKARAEYFLKLFMKRKPLIENYWRNLEVRQQQEKLDFSDPLYRADFDPLPRTLDTWQFQNRKARFFRDEAGGVNHSACLGIDAEGSVRGPALYEARVPVRSPRKFRVRVKCRADYLVEPGAKVSLCLYWRQPDGKKLSNSYDVEETLKPPYDDQWRTLTAYTQTPVAGDIRLCAGLRIDKTIKGHVRFDDLEIDATPEVIPDLEQYSDIRYNFTFDTPPLSWASWQSGTLLQFRRDAEGGRSGAALTIDGRADTQRKLGLYLAQVPCRGGDKMLIGAWIKLSPDAPGEAMGQLSVKFVDENKKDIAVAGAVTSAEYPAARDGKWRQVRFAVQAPEGARAMKLQLTGNRLYPGQVWFDDITVAAVPQAALNSPKYTRTLNEYTFDSPPLNWANWQSDPGAPLQFRRDDTGGRSGAALLIDGSKAAKRSLGLYVRQIDCPADCPLLFGAWIKVSADAPAGAVGRLKVEFRDANNRKIKISGADTASYPAVRDGQWRFVAVEVRSPADAKTVRISLECDGNLGGKVWFDDITVKTLPDAGK